MVVDDAACLHRRVDGRRADEAEPGRAQPLGELLGVGCLRVPAVPAARAGLVGAESPDELVQRRRVPEIDGPARVRNRRFDLAAVAHDPRIREEPVDVAPVEARDGVRVEVGESAPEVVALAQDREPREAGLEPFEAEALVQPTLVDDRPPPFLVVVRRVRGVTALPAAGHDLRHGWGETSTLTTPSSTRTGNVSTGSYAGSDSGRPVRRANWEPCLGQMTVHTSSSQSPSQSGPSSCEQRSSIAKNDPPQL